MPATTISPQRKKQKFARIQDRFAPEQRKMSFPVARMELNLTNGNNTDDEEKGIPFLATALGISVLLAAWPLLTFLRGVNSPTDGFDVDMFMTLKGMLDTTNGTTDNSMSMLTDENYQSIVNLPALSPAEQLVGAVFGPPHR